MRNMSLIWLWMIITALGIASCGSPPPASVTKDTPPASSTDAEPDPVSTGIFIPYSSNIRFETLSLQDGLSHSVVNVILQDRKGFLWIGTDDGLNRYDGYNFKVHKPDAADRNSLSDRAITSLAEDEHGYLWIGTRAGGVNRYDPVSGKFTQYTHNPSDDQSISSDTVYALRMDETGLWIGTDNGLDFLDFETGAFTHYRTSSETPPDPRSLSGNSIRALLKDSNGILWIGTANGGITLYNKARNSFTAHKFDSTNTTSLGSNRILSMAEGQNGEVWIGTANGLNRYNPVTRDFTRFQSSDDPASIAGNAVHTLRMDKYGGLWAGTDNGLSRYDPYTDGFVNHQHEPGIVNSLSNNKVQAIYEDQRGVLWIGTFGGGLNKYNRQQDWFAYHRHNPRDPASLSSNFVYPILADNRGYVWVGTYGGGLNRFNLETGKFIRFEHNPGIPSTISSNNIVSLLMDSSGALWIGTTRGLDRYHPYTSAFAHFSPPTGSESGDNPGANVSAIYEDSNKTLWVGTDRGLFTFNPVTGVFTPYKLNPDDPNPIENYIINAIREDRDGHLWVGTFDDGLKRIHLETNRITHFRNDPSLSSSLGNNAVMVIHQDRNGVLWVGTHGGGLNRYNRETVSFTHFTESDGLPNNVVYGILEDDAGSLWLSTNFGLSRFDPLQKSFHNYTASDGLQSDEFNQNSFAKDLYGNMYFGGINGFNIFKPKEIRDNPLPPKISLTSLTQDGVPLGGDPSFEYVEEVTLSWPRHSFEFEFTAFAYEQPSRNQYAYMLEGFDTTWINIGNQRTGRYTNLPGGIYTLRLRASNSDGVWNEQGQAISIVVIPPFWETWWFRGLLVIAFGISVTGVIRWRIKRVEKRNRELERLVRKRTADLEKRTDEIEALYLADEKILRSVTLRHVFQTLVDVSVSLLKADRSIVFVWDEENERIVPLVSRGFQPKTLSVLNFKQGEGAIGLAMKKGEPVVVPKINLPSAREDVRAAIQSEGIQSFAHFPIVVDGRVEAIFTVAHTLPESLNKDSIRLFTALVNRASMSAANMQLFEQTKDLAVMEERNRLARDLHDSAKQKAFAALAQLGTVNGIMKLTSNGVKSHLAEAENLIYEVIQELNFLIQEIYPIALQEMGLQAILREYVFEWENRNDIAASLTIENDYPLPLEMEQAVYRFVQEALANIARHSKASRVEISLSYNMESLQIIISDNGCGFDTNQKAKGLGFRSMRERIGGLRGTVQIQSAPGQGTRLAAHLPVKGITQEYRK